MSVQFNIDQAIDYLFGNRDYATNEAEREIYAEQTASAENQTVFLVNPLLPKEGASGIRNANVFSSRDDLSDALLDPSQRSRLLAGQENIFCLEFDFAALSLQLYVFNPEDSSLTAYEMSDASPRFFETLYNKSCEMEEQAIAAAQASPFPGHPSTENEDGLSPITQTYIVHGSEERQVRVHCHVCHNHDLITTGLTYANSFFHSGVDVPRNEEECKDAHLEQWRSCDRCHTAEGAERFISGISLPDQWNIVKVDTRDRSGHGIHDIDDLHDPEYDFIPEEFFSTHGDSGHGEPTHAEDIHADEPTHTDTAQGEPVHADTEHVDTAVDQEPREAECLDCHKGSGDLPVHTYRATAEHCVSCHDVADYSQLTLNGNHTLDSGHIDQGDDCLDCHLEQFQGEYPPAEEMPDTPWYTDVWRWIWKSGWAVEEITPPPQPRRPHN